MLWPHRPPIPLRRPRSAAGPRSSHWRGRSRRRGRACCCTRASRHGPSGGSRCPRSRRSACSCTVVVHESPSATGSCSAWGSSCRCSPGSARWSARSRGWRSSCSSPCSSGSAARGWRWSRGCPPRRCGRRRCGSRARRCAGACRGAGCRGAASVSVSRTARWCMSRRSAASRCCPSSRSWRGSRSASSCAAPTSGGRRRGRAGIGAAATALRNGARALVVPVVIVLAALATGPLAALVPPLSGGAGTTVTIAAVQGNVPRLGLDFNSQRRAVLDNHVTGDRAARRRRRRGQARPDPTS